jgi:hypothetical protein
VRAFRIFTNDVGPDAYSCLTRSKGKDANDALDKRHFAGAKCIAVEDDAESLLRYGPDGKTGKLPPDDILERGRTVGSFAGPRRYGR